MTTRLSDLSPAARQQAEAQGAVADKAKHKFGAVACELDGIWFSSKLERDVYAELQTRARAGEISELRLQVPFELVVNGAKIATYIVDFLFFDHRDGAGKPTALDAKGLPTPVYRLKLKLARALYPNVEFKEARRPQRKIPRHRKVS